MAQQAKIIDITKSYVPVDPDTYPQNLHGTTQEDAPVDAAPVVPYMGWNFLPTAYGYKSYFGIETQLQNSLLASRVDAIVPLQTTEYANILVAMCEDGIWLYKNNAWVHVVTLTPPTEDALHKEWTWAYLNDALHCYQAQGAYVYRVHADAALVTAPQASAYSSINTASCTLTQAAGALAARDITMWFSAKSEAGVPLLSASMGLVGSTSASFMLTIPQSMLPDGVCTAYLEESTSLGVYKKISGSVATISGTHYRVTFNYPDAVVTEECLQIPSGTVQTVTPTFLNMAGQQGIFVAGIRLGFWDAENSISWSSIDDLNDFTPSIETLAGSAIFGAVRGRIQKCLGHGEGFVIYATGSLVFVQQAAEATFQWNPTTLLDNSGIAFSGQCIDATPHTQHFAYTNTGIVKIEEGRLEFILPEFYDMMKGQDLPVTLNMLQGRYLCFEILEDGYLSGDITFTNELVGTTSLVLPEDTASRTEISGFTLEGSDFCYSSSFMLGGSGTQGMAEGQHNTSNPDTPPKDPNTWYEPVWDAYYKGFPGMANPTWVGAFCTPMLMSPNPNYQVDYFQNEGLDLLTQDTTLWQLDAPHLLSALGILLRGYAEKVDEYIAAIATRKQKTNPVVTTSGYHTKLNWQSGNGYQGENLTEWFTLGSTVSNIVDCEIGQYPTTWVGPYMHPGWCEIEIFLYATQRHTIKTHKEDVAIVSLDSIRPRGWFNAANKFSLPVGNTAYEACQLLWGAYSRTGDTFPILDPGTQTVTACYTQDWNSGDNLGSPSPGSVECAHYDGEQRKKETYSQAWNYISDTDEGVFARLAIVLKLRGWKYKDINGAERFIPKGAGTGCNVPDKSLPPKAPGSNDFPMPEQTDPEKNKDGKVCGIPFTPVTINDTLIPVIAWPTQTVTIPPASFLLQDGSIGPVYPTYAGAFVYDLQLQKWGKLRQPYKLLVTYKTTSGQKGQVVDLNANEIEGGLLDTLGILRKFDNQPADSKIVWGKIGYYRLGFTNLEEVRVAFAKPSKGTLRIEGSLDSRQLEAGLTESVTFDNVLTEQLNTTSSAKWYNIVLSGMYDITHLEFRGVRAGRR